MNTFCTRALRLAMLVLPMLVWVASASAAGLDYPHNASNNISCENCHSFWAVFSPDLQGDGLCLDCHDGMAAPVAATHSSANSSTQYGAWHINCKTCHSPHMQLQVHSYGAQSYAYSGTVDSGELGVTSFAETGAAWSVNQFIGYLFIPNVSNLSNNYLITANTANTLTLASPVDQAAVSTGNPYAIVYSSLIRDTIATPNSGERPVRFFGPTGPNSFADGDAVYDGICETCHTQPDHFRNDGSAPDQNHAGVGGGQAGNRCVGCHSHASGFGGHSGGTSGTGCESCHGHDPGYEYSPGLFSQGTGTVTSHSTHTENDADDLRGPFLACDACHDTDNFPAFKSGIDGDSNGIISLTETDVCDTCHSPGGNYNGVTNTDIGAKNNWRNGIYSGNDLLAGKEKWCAGCHDNAPSQILAVAAPNVIGDEAGAFDYGAGYGFYKTGHGLPADQTYPASGGITAGAGKGCLDCHDSATAHVDGLARTYDDGDLFSDSSALYRQGYRLKQIGGLEPMLAPRPYNTFDVAANNRLCISCHDVGPFSDPTNFTTNFVTSDGVNRHWYHLATNNQINDVRADWSGVPNSLPNCIVCHNVHGSTRLAMVRDGKLIGSEPGIRIWYYNPAIMTYNNNDTNPPSIVDLPLSASTGTVWQNFTATNTCAAGCHANETMEHQNRTPFQPLDQPPTLNWTGEINYITDGVNPDAGLGQSLFTFRVKYADPNNDPPDVKQVWVDTDDSGTYDPGETFTLNEAEPGDAYFVNGKIYTLPLVLAKAGDNQLNYRFYAVEGANIATGPPTSDMPVGLLNNAPNLDWTGEASYIGDGVNPDTGANGGNFQFRVKYTDKDNEPPISIQVWVDIDDSGTYSAGEQWNLTAVDGDTVYSDGKIYGHTLALDYVGDGAITYRFFANDGTDNATGNAVADRTVNITSSSNAAPVLTWVTEECLTNGVKPALGLATADFQFKVQYIDTDPGECPQAASDIQVWIDLNDNGTYDEATEYFNLSPVDADADCTDGKIYAITMPLAHAGDGVLNYRFYATDTTDTAVGLPIADNIVTVASTANTFGVRPGSETGPVWYNSIQSAMNALSGANNVLVYPGAYSSINFLSFNDDNTVVRSVCGPDLTSINGAGTVVNFNYAITNSVLDGFQITGGTRGVATNAGSMMITNCTIQNNTNATSGAGIYLGNGTVLTLSDSEVSFNSTTGRGGGVQINGATLHVSNTLFDTNAADSGGAVYVQGTANIADATFQGNTATGVGGALHLNGATLDVSRSVFDTNRAAGQGGALYAQSSANIAVTDTVFQGNTTTGNSGGAVFLSQDTLTLNRCFFLDNTAAIRGGAIYMDNSSTNVTLTNSVVAGNAAPQGGGIDTNVGTLTVINSTIADNQATTGNGGGLSKQGGPGTITVRNSILWNNLAGSLGQIAWINSGASMTISDAIMNNNGDGVFTNSPYFGGAGTVSVSGYLSETDPVFVDTATDNYHLQSTSVAIDNGNATYAPDDDIDGDARPQGTADDIGADEYTP